MKGARRISPWSPGATRAKLATRSCFTTYFRRASRIAACCMRACRLQRVRNGCFHNGHGAAASDRSRMSENGISSGPDAANAAHQRALYAAENPDGRADWWAALGYLEQAAALGHRLA